MFEALGKIPESIKHLIIIVPIHIVYPSFAKAAAVQQGVKVINYVKHSFLRHIIGLEKTINSVFYENQFGKIDLIDDYMDGCKLRLLLFHWLFN